MRNSIGGSMENLYKVMREYGITTDEACETITNMPKIPFSEVDVALIRNNPSLSWFQKRKLIGEVKNNMMIN